jgi:hypothetical protein
MPGKSPPPGNHLTGGWMSPRANLDVMEMGEMLDREGARTLTRRGVQPVANR